MCTSSSSGGYSEPCASTNNGAASPAFASLSLRRRFNRLFSLSPILNHQGPMDLVAASSNKLGYISRI